MGIFYVLIYVPYVSMWFKLHHICYAAIIILFCSLSTNIKKLKGILILITFKIFISYACKTMA
jgi:hypothetical protein